MAEKTEDKHKHKPLVPWIYDLGLWIFTLCLDIFFRQIYPRGAWRVPKTGPVIIVAAPHNNQFVDSAVLMRLLKSHAGRRVSFLTAEKSMREPYIGAMAGAMGALPVARGMDKAKAGIGTVYLPDAASDPTLLRGVDTDFTTADFMVGGSVTLPKLGKEPPENQTIAEIISETELRIKNPFQTDGALQQLSAASKNDVLPQRGSRYKVSPHIDQSEMFDVVFEQLLSGGCVGIFPEGGSHDRSNLLPLKPGAAIIALGLLARDPNCGVSIIPCGLNYFHAHKFRSRAVVEFGHPVRVDPAQVEAYKAGGSQKRNAVASLLETIHDGLAAVTQLSPDHETLQLIQATRRLYSSTSKKLPLSVIIEFNRRLLTGYERYQNDARVVSVKKAVLDYNRQLQVLGVKDHQIAWRSDLKETPWWVTLYKILSRLLGLAFLAAGTLPGLLLFWPVFVVAKVISVKKQRKALAASEVKLQGRDIVSTWKILVAMGLAPALYAWYTMITTVWLYYNRHGYYPQRAPWWINGRTYIPDWVPLWLFSATFWALMIAVTFAALRTGEVGMDIIKSLPPLLVSLNPASASLLQKLRVRRQALSIQITDLINTLGPEVFPDFDADRIAAEAHHHGRATDAFQSRLKSMPPSRPESRGRRSSDRSERSGSPYSTSFQPLNVVQNDSLMEVNKKISDAVHDRES